MKSIISIFSIGLLSIIFFSCDNDYNSLSKKEIMVQYAKDHGIHEFITYSNEFPNDVSEEDWKKFVDNYKKLKVMEKENFNDVLMQQKVIQDLRDEMRAALSEAKRDSIFKVYASKYDFIFHHADKTID